MNHFYQNLGKLFYAVAAADKKVSEAEVEKLKADVTKYWLALEDSTDYFGSDAAFQIEIVFDWLIEEMPNSEKCYQDFATFRKKHDSIFTKPVKELIWKTCEDIASSSNSKNKSELVLLSRISQLLG
ncbi:MAG: hypothetical protein HYZ14_08600 [Bacteroidetes bacterium]|nr:hypothetical protein [Bacteroidota bacterium]